MSNSRSHIVYTVVKMKCSNCNESDHEVKHSDKKLQFWCSTCSIPICSSCITLRHQGHQYTEVGNELSNEGKTVSFEFCFWQIKSKLHFNNFLSFSMKNRI